MELEFQFGQKLKIGFNFGHRPDPITAGSGTVDVLTCRPASIRLKGSWWSPTGWVATYESETANSGPTAIYLRSRHLLVPTRPTPTLDPSACAKQAPWTAPLVDSFL